MEPILECSALRQYQEVQGSYLVIGAVRVVGRSLQELLGRHLEY